VILQARINAGLRQKRLHDQERRYLQAIERELEIGREIQSGFLPAALPQPVGWEIASRFQAAREVAGDFYDAFVLPDGMIGLVIADVCGKGVGAALFMTLFRSLIRAGSNLEVFTSRAYTRADSAPTVASLLRDAIQLTNNYIQQIHGASTMFATIFFGVLDPASGALSYINAGHEPPLIVGPAGVKRMLRPTGPLVGVFPNRAFAVADELLEPGETLLAFTDGVTDAKSVDGLFFTVERLLALLETPADSATALLDRINAALCEHIAEAPQFDDITLLAIRRACVANSDWSA
jgi:phosphoserine phosphatase RsbU/P